MIKLKIKYLVILMGSIMAHGMQGMAPETPQEGPFFAGIPQLGIHNSFEPRLRKCVALVKNEEKKGQDEEWRNDTNTRTYSLDGPVKRQVIIRVANITTLTNVDAIVNAANTQLRWGGGICGAIFSAAGKEALEGEVGIVLNKMKRSSIDVGEAVITPIPASTNTLPTINNAFQKIRYVVHAVGPDCRIAFQNAHRGTLLANAYKNSLLQANEKGVKSIAFPAISTDIFRCPIEDAAVIAIDTILKTVKDTDIRQVICVFLTRGELYEKYVKILDEKLRK